MAVEPEDYFELSMDELREVARYAAHSAQEVLTIFEQANPGDRRPAAAIEAAWQFAHGAERTKLQRVTALAAHRAAGEAATVAAKHAAHAAGDAASAAYLHPFAKADQVGHILRAAAHSAYAAGLLADDPAVGQERIAQDVMRATPLLIVVLRRYPPAATGKNPVTVLMRQLDVALRSR